MQLHQQELLREALHRLPGRSYLLRARGGDEWRWMMRSLRPQMMLSYAVVWSIYVNILAWVRRLNFSNIIFLEFLWKINHSAIHISSIIIYYHIHLELSEVMVVPMVASFSRREWPWLGTESYAEDSESDQMSELFRWINYGDLSKKHRFKYQIFSKNET